jgi:SNF2 family DNA or RNA helicase
MRNSDTFAVRREAQQIFQNEVPEKEITIFMTTTNMAGFGLDLYKAKRCILLEPCWLSSTEVQCFARIFRIGQNAPYSYAYRYVCAEEWIEKHILMRQDKRKAVRDEVFSEAIDELAAAVAEDDMEEGAKRLREADHTAVLSTKRQRTDVDNGDVV